MTEAQLQQAVIEAAQLLGWRVAHFRPARTKDGGWVTPVAADGKGFPDLVLVKGGTLAFVELKSENGKLSAEQKDWLHALEWPDFSDDYVVEVWRPKDWTSGKIERFLATAG